MLRVYDMFATSCTSKHVRDAARLPSKEIMKKLYRMPKDSKSKRVQLTGVIAVANMGVAASTANPELPDHGGVIRILPLTDRQAWVPRPRSRSSRTKVA